MVISSRDNPLIKKISALSEKKYRKIYGEFLVESIKAVGECISSGMQIEQIVCTEALADKYPDAVIVTEQLFARISTEQTPQGVLAVVKTPQRTLGEIAGKCILLDRIQDPGNLGTIIRTANAAGYDKILAADCAEVYSPKAIRASMGGVFYVDVYECDLQNALNALKGCSLICADMGGEDVFNFVPPKNYCLCIGNEGGGIDKEVFARARSTVKIPMRETCESLNAAISAAICMYALKNNSKEK